MLLIEWDVNKHIPYRFRPTSAMHNEIYIKELHNVIFDQISVKTYDALEAVLNGLMEWIIANLIVEKLRGEIHSSKWMKWLLNNNSLQLYDFVLQIISNVPLGLKFKRYKNIVNVVMDEQYRSGVKMSTWCIWDAEADVHAYDGTVNLFKYYI